MYNMEAAPKMERFEIDPALWTEPSQNDQQRSASEFARLAMLLGRTAVAATIETETGSAFHSFYLRGRYDLSSEDVRQLEEYIAFLRQHYGIPEGASVFPKKEPVPVLEPPAEERDEA